MLNGKWSYTKPENPKLTLTFDNDVTVYFSESRNIGYVKLANDLPEMGVGVMDITLPEFTELINSKASVYSILMDQNKICGIGNYLACEILYDSNIYPRVRGEELNKEDISRLYKSMRGVIQDSIDSGGSCHYKIFDEAGGYIPRVYKKSKKTMRIGGRTVYY